MPDLRASDAPARHAPPRQGSKSPIHLPLHRRLLFPTRPLDTPLPPIVVCTDPSPELELINERILHLVALTLRGYVQWWYPRISPRDRSLLPALHSSILHPILSPILTGVHDEPEPLVRLLLLDLPTILALHVRTYWDSQAAVQARLDRTSHDKTEWTALGQAYHARLPLLAVSPTDSSTTATASGASAEKQDVQSDSYALDPLYLTSLSDALLKLYLPPVEYAAAVERTMGRELLGRVVLGSVARRLGEGWFWSQILLKLLGEPGAGLAPSRKKKTLTSDTHVGDVLKALFRVCGQIWRFFWLAWAGMVSLMATLSAAPPHPAYRGVINPWLALGREVLGIDGRSGLVRQRWAAGIIWAIVEAVCTLFSPLLDRLLPYLVRTRLLTPSVSLRLISLIEYILFPLDGYPAPSPPDPTHEEALDLRLRLEMRLHEVLPLSFQRVFCPTRKEVGAMLDPLANRECNAHLVAMLLDALVRSLVPQLAVQEVGQLGATEQGLEGQMEGQELTLSDTDTFQLAEED